MQSMLLGVTASGIVRVESDEVVDLDLPFADLGALLVVHDSFAVAASAAERGRRPLAETAFVCPFGAATTIWGVGLNYHAKAAQTGRGVPSEPILFLKPPRALAGPDAKVAIPFVPSDELDYEAEVAIVIGTELSDATPEQAWAAVAGITPANDMTARDVMKRVGNPGFAKGFDGFSPIGPTVLTADELAPDFDLRVRGYVNGELRQDGRTSDFIFSVPDLLSRLSKFATLCPGDVVLTGTPPGTGQDLGIFLQPDDRVTVEIERLLPLHATLAG